MSSCSSPEPESPSCASFLRVLTSFSSACAATIPVTPGWQWQRCRHDAADHPGQLGLMWYRWGAA